jgi:copper chaperone NosL
MRTTSRLSRGARALTLIAAVMLGALYFTPLWSVRLVAPQYPEGIGMDIHLSTVTGAKEHDLRNINALNHYIGMKEIHPESIPELRYMPWILGVLIAAGLVAAAMGRRRGLATWLALLLVAGSAGLWDFWRWNYDYGHNLDLERAIIVIPGQTYQPPIIGSKQIANFTATAYPALGGILAGVAFALGAAALWLSYRRRTPFGVAGVVVAAACATSTPAIALGASTCAECRMLITDARFGAALVSTTGKQLDFDSVDCLLDYMRANPATPKSVWVAQADSRGVLIPAAQARFARDGALRPPMGTAVSYAASSSPVEALTWNELQATAVHAETR